MRTGEDWASGREMIRLGRRGWTNGRGRQICLTIIEWEGKAAKVGFGGLAAGGGVGGGTMGGALVCAEADKLGAVETSMDQLGASMSHIAMPDDHLGALTGLDRTVDDSAILRSRLLVSAETHLA
jgi:hypothetical protein